MLGNSFAARVQLPALRWAGYNRVCALAGEDAEKARATAQEWGIPHATGDWRTALEIEPDLVLVASPVHLQALLQTLLALPLLLQLGAPHRAGDWHLLLPPRW